MAKTATAVAARTEASPNQTTTPAAPRVDRPRFELWKPKKGGGGAAAIFEVASNGNCFFLKMLPETGQETGAKFDNERSIQVKLGPSDVGDMIAVIVGLNEGLGKKNDKGFWTGLYHENATGNSSIGLSRSEHGGFILRVSVKKGDSPVIAYQVGITNGESCLLKIFLERYSWMFFESNDQ